MRNKEDVLQSVADAWWKKTLRMVDFAAFEPRKGAGLEHTYFTAHVPR